MQRFSGREGVRMLAAAGFLVLMATGCESRAKMLEAPEYRSIAQNIVRKDCASGAKKAVDAKTVAWTEAQQTDYCGCVSTDGTASLTNPEMQQLEYWEKKKMTPETRAKLDAGTLACGKKVFGADYAGPDPALHP